MIRDSLISMTTFFRVNWAELEKTKQVHRINDIHFTYI